MNKFYISLLFFFTAVSANSQSFVATTIPGLTEDMNSSLVVAAGDYNNDGHEDIFLGNYPSAQNFLYRNNGDGTFTRMDGLAPSQDFGNTTGANWIDYNNDGYLDLYVINQSEVNFLYTNNGDGTFTKEVGNAISDGLITNGFNSSWADYNNDGWPDVYVTNSINDVTTGKGNLFRNNGDGTFTEEFLFSSDNMAAAMSVWLDYDKDRNPDLYIINNGQRNQLFRNNGDNSFTEILTGAHVTDIESSWSTSVGNFNNDSWSDLVVADNLINSLYHGSSYNKIITARTGYQGGTSVGDYNNDGRVDYVTSSNSGVQLFTNNGSNIFSTTTLETNGHYGTLFTDITGDGYLDIIVTNYPNLGITVYENTLINSNHFVKIKLEGVESNAPAITAKMYLYTPSGYYFREKVSSNGWAADGPGYTHIGIGSATSIDQLNIQWPDGSNSYHYDLKIDELNIIKGMGPNLQTYMYETVHTYVKVGTSWSIDAYSYNEFDYATEGFSTKYYISSDTIIDETDYLLDSLYSEGLDAYNYAWSSIYPTIPVNFPLGNYYLIMKADSEDEINETMESDNIIIKAIEITDQDAPNPQASVYLSSQNYNPGTTIQFNYVRVSNWTTIGVSDVEVKFLLSADQYASAEDSVLGSTIVDLPAYSEVYLNPELMIPETMPIGTRYLLMVVDPDNLITEKSEADNVSSGWLQITNNPVNPTGLAASPVTTSRIDLTWNDNTTVETNYIVLRDEVQIASLPPDSEYYSDLTAIAGVTYEYRIQAINGPNSAYSNYVTVTIDNSTDAEIMELVISGDMVSNGGFSISSAWGDYDNDGDDDLFVSNYAQTNFLYANNGDGTFTKITTGSIVTDINNSVNASWADFDNDGWLDLYVSNYEEDNKLYKNNGDGTFMDIATAAGVAGGGNQGCAWGDYDQDGWVDLILSSGEGVSNTLYKNNGDGTFSSVTKPGITDSGGDAVNAMWVDVNNDSWLDLFIAHLNYANELYINQGNGEFSQYLSGGITNDIEASWGAVWGDYNQDGYLDLYVLNKGQSNSLYRNYGYTFEKINIGTSGGLANSESASWIDMDNDGDLDLFVANSGENNMLFRNNGDDSFTRMLVGGIVNEGNRYSTSSSVADVNNDGFPDLFVANANDENNLLYINGGNSNNFLTVKLEGIVGNRSAIGASVSFRASNGVDEFYYSSQVMSQTGARAQNSLELEFGIGDATDITDFTVNWPDGRSTGHSIDGVNQKIIIKGMGVDLRSYMYDNVKTIVKQGNDLNIDANVLNNSNYASEAFKVAYYISVDTIIGAGDILFDTLSVSSLTAFGNTYVGVSNQISNTLPLGDYHLIMKADYQDALEETDELNNYIIRDLTITDLDLTDVSTYVSSTRYNYNAGTTIDINGYLYNNSEVDITETSFKIVYSQDDVIDDNDSLIMLVDGLVLPSYEDYQFDTSYLIPELTPQGDYYLIIMADFDSLLLESNEVNNFYYRTNYISDTPAQPTGLATSVAAVNQIDLLWQDHANNETSYTVVRNGIDIATLGADVTTYSDNDVQIDTEYLYRVYASNPSGDSWYSNQATGLIANIPQLLIAETSDIVANDGGSSSGQAWGDYNNDGFVDLFVANNGDPSFLYTNNGDGSFTKMTTGAIVTNVANSISASWADYNNDGWLDLYVVNNGQNNYLYKNNGNGTFSNVTTTAGVAAGNMSSAWGDYNKDGWVDLYVTNTGNTNNILYKNNKDGTFSSVTITGVTTGGGNSNSANWVDINNDGWLDLFIANYQQANQLFTNNGDETFTRWTSGNIVEDVEDSWGGSWADYNNDGYPDLFVTNKNGNSNSLYRNQYGSSFTKITTDDIVQDASNSESSSWGDYDNDGDLDLFVANILENNMLFQNDGNGLFTRVVLGEVVNDGSLISTSCGFADINNDGFLDLFVTNAAGQNNLLYINSTNENNWIKLQLSGVNENPAAIGTSITLSSSGHYLTRQVSSQTGARAQASMEVHFGLGSVESIYDITIQWPNGEYKYYSGLTVGQTHKINGMGLELIPYLEPRMVVKVKQGDSRYIEGWVNNNSSYVADSVFVEYYLSADQVIDETDLLLGNYTQYDLPDYSSDQFFAEYTIPVDFPIGDYYLIMDLDPNDWNNEINEANNQVDLAFTVVDYDLSDLLIFTQLSNFTHNPGTNLDFSVELGNTGDVDVLDAPINFYISTNSELSAEDELILSDTVDLSVDQIISFDTTYSLPGAMTTGTYYLIAVIDEVDVIEELNDVNNIWSRAFGVVLRPADPTNLSASVTNLDNEISLYWQDNSNNEDQYVIERDFEEIAVLGPDEIAYIDSDLETDQRYEYRIRATNGSGNSSWRYVSFTLLTPPTDLTSEIQSDGSISLAWTDNSTMESGYEIYRNNEYLVNVENVTTYVDYGVSPENTYTYKVIAVTYNNGHSNYSNEETIEILASPSGLDISIVSENESHLVWADNSGLETAYIIERNGIEIANLPANTIEYSDTDISPDNTYEYSINAISNNGESGSIGNSFTLLASPVLSTSILDNDGILVSWIDNSSMEDSYQIFRDDVMIGSTGANETEHSDYESFIDPENTYSYKVRAVSSDGGESMFSNIVNQELLAAPTDLNIIVNDLNQPELTWTENSNLETGYTVERDGIVIANLEPNSNQFTDAEATPEDNYDYAVKAVSTQGASSYNRSSFVFLAAPTNVVASLSASNEVTVTWTDNSSMETGYELYRNDVLLITLGASLLEYTDTDASPEELYEYSLRAIADGGSSEYTDKVGLRVLNAPTSLTASELSKTEIKLTWTDNSSFENAYIIERNGIEVGSTDANIEEFTDGGLTTEVLYSYRVKALSDEPGESEYSNVAEITINPDSEGPVISIIQGVNSYVSGASAQFVVGVTDELSEVSEVKAWHRKLSNPASSQFTSVTMTVGNSDEYSFALSSAMVDELGVMVVFEAKDAYNNVSHSDTIRVYMAYAAETINISGIKSGVEVSSYQIFSVPLDLTNKNVESVFSGLGTYDNTKWRVFRYMNGDNKEYKDGFTTIDRGKGYWLISSEIDNTMSLGEGDHELPNDRPFEMQLQAGWNQIGDPYLFNVSWTDVLEYNNLTTADLSSLQVFNSGSYSVSDVLRKFQGGFVNSPGSMTIKIPYEKNPSVQGGRTTETRSSEGSIDSDNWMLAMTLDAGEISYNISGVGMHPKASVSRDVYDELTAPRFLGYLELNFTHPEHHWPYFTKDVVPSTDNHTWDFTVESNLDEEQLVLKWDNSIISGTEKRIMLLDISSNVIINMAEQSEYSFANAGKHPFKIVYGNTAYVNDQLIPSLSNVMASYPNPFTNEITIPFVLKDSEHQYEVELAIFSINGEVLKTITNGKLSAGYYEFTWDGQSFNGNDLPSGVYLQQLTVINGKEKTTYRSKLMKR